MLSRARQASFSWDEPDPNALRRDRTENSAVAPAAKCSACTMQVLLGYKSAVTDCSLARSSVCRALRCAAACMHKRFSGAGTRRAERDMGRGVEWPRRKQRANRSALKCPTKQHLKSVRRAETSRRPGMTRVWWPWKPSQYRVGSQYHVPMAMRV